MNKQKGFTLIELIVSLALLGTVGLIVLVFSGGCSPDFQHEAAVSGAKGYAKDLGYELKAVSCVKFDSDHDGYVSCTIRVAGETGQPEPAPLHVECAGVLDWNEGCRKPKMKVDNWN